MLYSPQVALGAINYYKTTSIRQRHDAKEDALECKKWHEKLSSFLSSTSTFPNQVRCRAATFDPKPIAEVEEEPSLFTNHAQFHFNDALMMQSGYFFAYYLLLLRIVKWVTCSEEWEGDYSIRYWFLFAAAPTILGITVIDHTLEDT